MRNRFSKTTIALGVLAFVLVGAATAWALTYKAGTSVYNPGNHAITVASKWVDGAGVPGGSNTKGVVLAMSRTDIYPPGTSADVTINKMCIATDSVTHECITGTSLSSLGFDRLKVGTCTNSAPTWDVETLNGDVYFIGCSDGVHTDLTGFQSGWERVVYSDSDWEFRSGTVGTCNFSNNTGGCQVVFLQFHLDEGPAVAIVDNFLVNGQVIGTS